jgi:hypothetical protein
VRPPARKNLSRRESLGRSALRFRTFTWWRRTRVSASRSRSSPAGANRRTTRSTHIRDGEQHPRILLEPQLGKTDCGIGTPTGVTANFPGLDSHVHVPGPPLSHFSAHPALPCPDPNACVKGALTRIVALTGFPSGPVGWSRTRDCPMMADGSLLRSGGETWGPVSPDNVHETGVSLNGQSGFPIVAAEAQ